jgi:N-acetylglucosaminyldiphosphoundecaprenol N-acetyl-beta-D-mannosaminyltransferase
LKNFYFKNIKVSCCNLKDSVSETLSVIKTGKPNYICVTDAGNIVNAYRNSPELKDAINGALLSLPDGRPISMFAKFKGIKNIERVAGPDFMSEVFRRTSGTDIKHFFLGDTEEIHNLLQNKIKEKFDLQIAGFYGPDFDKWNDETDNEILNIINKSDADIIWVSLGGGKQEVLMKNNFRKLDKGIMIGVGAAFRFYTGKIKRAPLFFQKAGLEWLFRLIQQPRKMFKRYLTTLPFFVLYSLQEGFKSKSNSEAK